MVQKNHFDWLWPWVKDMPLRRAIDCGAHKGYWTIEWADKIETIECFEPNAEILTLFKENTAHLKNINLYEHALGDKPGTVTMDYDTHVGTYHIISEQGPHEVKTLDSYNFTDVDIIKIDGTAAAAAADAAREHKRMCVFCVCVGGGENTI